MAKSTAGGAGGVISSEGGVNGSDTTYRRSCADLGHSSCRQILEKGEVLARPGARRGIDRAERAERLPRGVAQRHTSIRHDPQIAARQVVSHQRTVRRILHDKSTVARHDVLAERMRERRPALVTRGAPEAGQSGKVLSAIIHERDKRNRHREERTRNTREPVKDLKPDAVEEERCVQRRESSGISEPRQVHGGRKRDGVAEEGHMLLREDLMHHPDTRTGATMMPHRGGLRNGRFVTPE